MTTTFVVRYLVTVYPASIQSSVSVWTLEGIHHNAWVPYSHEDPVSSQTLKVVPWIEIGMLHPCIVHVALTLNVSLLSKLCSERRLTGQGKEAALKTAGNTRMSKAIWLREINFMIQVPEAGHLSARQEEAFHSGTIYGPQRLCKIAPWLRRAVMALSNPYISQYL